MSFKEEIKQKKDYFTKVYTKEEILRTFHFILKRAGINGEVQGKTEEMKITQIDGDVITVQAKIKDKNDIRLYRLSLQFNQMENEELTREAKIASPERYGEVVELKTTISNEEKQVYYEETVDYWDEKEEREEKIENLQQTNHLMETYKKEDLLRIVDRMLQTSANSQELYGQIQERKIVRIEGNTVSVAVKTKDMEQIVRVYVMNLDFNKMPNISYRKDAKIASPLRMGAIKEVKGIKGNAERQDFYNRIPDFWDNSMEQDEQQK